MYLSRVFLRPGRLDNAYEWHRALWSLFPSVESGSVSPFLYYMESVNPVSGAQLLMQSSIEPVAVSKQANVLATKSVSLRFEKGQRLAFRLLANPTKCISDKEHKDHKRNQGKCRVPLIKEEDQVAWFRRKVADVANMEVLATRNCQPLYFRKGRRAGKIVPVSFEGVIEVCDAEKMRDIWEKGIGPAKAFGCGLLMVRRA